MNRRGFLRALGFGLPAAAACAALPAVAGAPSAAAASVPLSGGLAIGVLSGRLRTRQDHGNEWLEVPEVVYVKKGVPVHRIRLVQGAPAEVYGVTSASTFPKA